MPPVFVFIVLVIIGIVNFIVFILREAGLVWQGSADPLRSILPPGLVFVVLVMIFIVIVIVIIERGWACLAKHLQTLLETDCHLFELLRGCS